MRKKKKIPKLQKGGFISKETAKELGFYRGHDNELTPEQLKKFTKEVEKALLEDLYKRWGLIKPIEEIIIIKHKIETINVSELIKKKKLSAESED